jgi:ubiquinone/menaquinone biosynthesis C-methylase UbiE
VHIIAAAVDFLPGEAHFGSRWRERVARRFLSPGPKDELLDAGCGCGAITMAMARDVRRITGVDISEAAVRLAQRVAERRGIANARFLAGDLTRLSSLVAEESFDAAYCLDTLEHAEDFPRILSEVRRALRPGGRFFLLVPASEEHGHFQHDMGEVHGIAEAGGWSVRFLERLSPPRVTKTLHELYLKGRHSIAGREDGDVDVCHETRTFGFSASPPWYVRAWAAAFPLLWWTATLADREPYRRGGSHIASLLERAG